MRKERRRYGRGVAKDRRISIEDAQIRHGRKSRSVQVDGYKRHVVHDSDSCLAREHAADLEISYKAWPVPTGPLSLDGLCPGL